MSISLDRTSPSEKSLAIKKALSEDRLTKYLQATDRDLEKALELYTWNTQIGGALYGSLQGFEVILRNAMSRELVTRYGETWHANKPVVFQDQQMDRITKVKERWKKERPITLPDIVADLSFGFWSDILEHRIYDELWKTTLHKAFPNRSKGTRRPDAAAPVIKLYRLRNRIAHHEPIWQRNLDDDHDTIIRIASWICPQTSEWIKDQSTLENALNLKPAWLDKK